jgi:hypothetical protein
MTLRNWLKLNSALKEANEPTVIVEPTIVDGAKYYSIDNINDLRICFRALKRGDFTRLQRSIQKEAD